MENEINSTPNQLKIDLEVNTLYLCALAMDLLLRDSEERMRQEGQCWKQEKKRMFTQYLDYVKKACIVHDKIYQDVISAEEQNRFKYFHVWQEEANELVRLMLLYSDGSENLSFVSELFTKLCECKTGTIVDQEMLDKFFLNKAK